MRSLLKWQQKARNTKQATFKHLFYCMAHHLYLKKSLNEFNLQVSMFGQVNLEGCLAIFCQFYPIEGNPS